MVDIEQTYLYNTILCDYKWLRFILVFIDSVFRGIGQVMFANNALSGFIITIGLFIGNWELAFYGLLGTSVSTLTAHVFGFDYKLLRAGLYGYNGCLVSMGITNFTFPQSPQMIGPVIIMSIFSTIFLVAIGKILVQRLGIPPFTFSFQICTWIWLFGALKYRYFFLNGTILSPVLLTTNHEKPSYGNMSHFNYSFEDNFVGFFASIAQVYFISSPYTGVFIIIGVLFCSRILAFFALFGAVTGQLSAAYLLGLSAKDIHAGLWGFNSVLTCQALGGMFFVLSGYRIWLLTLYGSIMTVIVQAAVSAFLSPTGMPTLTFPFTFICWIFCLIAGSKDLIAVKLTGVSIPEDHCHRFHISNFIKGQLQFINRLINRSSSPNEDMTIEEFEKMKEILPILMCAYANQNDLINMESLRKATGSIHVTDHNFRSPLHISACQGNMKISKWLIDDGKVKVNLVDKYGGTPLYDAFWNGHTELLSFLYSRGARMSACKSKELAFYLNVFVFEDNLEAIKCLIICGFDPNTGDYDGRTALHSAVIMNRFDIVRYLVEETSVNLNAIDYFQETPKQYASHLSDPIILNYLQSKVTHHTSPIIRKIGITHDNRKTDSREMCRMRIEQNCLPAAMYQSVANGDMTRINKLLQEFPNLKALECVDYDLRSIAHFAASAGQLEIIRFLREHCDNDQFNRLMNLEDRWGFSPIDEAYRHQHFHIGTFMKEHLLGQNVSQSLQSNLENKNIVYLLQKWKKIFLFCTLAASGAAERIDALFARGYFVRTELYADYNGRTPMHLAAAYGRVNVVQLLTRYGYNGTIHMDRWGTCPKDEAQRMNFKEIIDELEKCKM